MLYFNEYYTATPEPKMWEETQHVIGKQIFVCNQFKILQWKSAAKSQKARKYNCKCAPLDTKIKFLKTAGTGQKKKDMHC